MVAALAVGFGCSTQPALQEGAHNPAPPEVLPAPAAPLGTAGAVPNASEPSEPSTPVLAVETAPFIVGRLEVQRLAPALFEAAAAVPSLPPVPYERFRLLATLHVGHSHLSMLDLSADEARLLAVSESEAQLRVYDTETRRLIVQAPVLGYEKFGIGDFLFWPRPDHRERVLFASAQGLNLIDPTGPADALVLSEDRAALLKVQNGLVGSISTSRSGSAHASVLTLYEPESPPALVPVLSVVASERVEDWVLSADRTRLGVVYYPSLAIEWIDLKARQLLWRAKAPEFTNSLDLSPDDTLLAAGGERLQVFSVTDPEQVKSFAQFGNNIHQVRFAPAGDAVAASSYDGHVRIVSVASSSSTLTLQKALRHTGTANVYAFRFTRDGRRLYSCSGDRTLRVFGL